MGLQHMLIIENKMLGINGENIDKYLSILAESNEGSLKGRSLSKPFEMAQTFYHGSPRGKISCFIQSTAGSYGEGVYFADYDCAWEYANGSDENITSVWIKAINPYYYIATYEAAEAFDLDSYAIDLILALFEKDEAISIIDKAIQNEYCHFNGEIKRRLKEMGHDCLVVSYEDESFEVIVLENLIIEVLE